MLQAPSFFVNLRDFVVKAFRLELGTFESRICVVATLSLLIAAAAYADPHSDYMLHCQGCHGPDGSGAPGAVPSFRQQIGKFRLVPGGREYLIRVPGVSQSELSDARVAAVLNWIVEEFDAESDAAEVPPFTVAEVARHRRPPLAVVATVRRELLRAIESR
jgi:mono/diheme cytochrome c family protein